LGGKNLPFTIKHFKTPDNQTEIKVMFEEDTVWLTQAQMAELFDRNRVAITQHIGKVFKEGELEERVVCKDYLHTNTVLLRGKHKRKA
jgi:hypothetical protein